MTRSRLLAALSLLVALGFAARVVYPSSRQLTHGFAAYYSASRLLWAGRLTEKVYDPAYFRPIVRQDSQGQADDIFNANPPTMALLLGPLGLLPAAAARFAWSWTNLLLMAAGLLLLVWATGRLRTDAVWLVLLAAMLFRPAVANFRLGQAYIALFFLLALATAALIRGRDSLAGLALAPPLILKTSGWPLLPLLAWQRRWKALAGLAAGSAAALLLTLPLAPPAMWPAYLSLLADVTGSPLVCVTAYQTTRSFLCRLFVYQPEIAPTPWLDAPWLATAILLLLAVLALLAVLRLSARSHPLAFVATVAWSVLFAPLGEEYHHVLLLIPLAWLLAPPAGYAPGRFGQAAVAIAIILYALPLTSGGSQGWAIWLAYPRLWGGWLLFLALLDASRSRPIDRKRQPAIIPL
jgi:alpha-1,2-mannosyltransferase